MSENSRASKKILVIEDEEAILRLINLVLKKAGYQVSLAPNGHDGLAMFEPLQPDVVISDMKMPRMNGHDLMEALDQWRAKRPFFTLLISGSLLDETAVRDQEGRNISFLQKPFTGAQLLKCVDHYFDFDKSAAG